MEYFPPFPSRNMGPPPPPQMISVVNEHVIVMTRNRDPPPQMISVVNEHVIVMTRNRDRRMQIRQRSIFRKTVARALSQELHANPMRNRSSSKT